MVSDLIDRKGATKRPDRNDKHVPRQKSRDTRPFNENNDTNHKEYLPSRKEYRELRIP